MFTFALFNTSSTFMISFLIALVLLVAGYFIYGRLVERVFEPDDRPTPAVAKADGVDFLVLPGWKIFMIQFLNIAGTGPIFGAIMGAKFGPVSYLWIVFGCIFAGAVHDYLSGMLSMRHGGANLPELIGHYLGKTTKQVMLYFSIFLLMMVGVVFVYSPAEIMSDIWTPQWATDLFGPNAFWIGLIFIYYVIATMMPIDKIIGKIYPLFAFSLIFMALALLASLLFKHPVLPEVWDGLGNLGAKELGFTDPIFPCLFITIACGAISGFHATQSPLMARCVKSEHQGRRIFYGAMITEGIVALIWATIAMYFFYAEPTPGYQLMQQAQATGIHTSAPSVVNIVCNEWLGVAGGILALLGVVAAPITSGDTAFRSCRLIVADVLHFEQHPQTTDDLHPDVRRGDRIACMADGQSRRFQDCLGMVRMGKPDISSVHALDADGLSGAPSQAFHHHADTRSVYDNRMQHILIRQRPGFVAASHGWLRSRSSCAGGVAGVVLCVVQAREE